MTATPTARLIQGDCLDAMGAIADASIDLVCCDLPYQSTQCKWDRRIDPAALWLAYRRVLKPRGAIVLNADFRLACELVATAPKRWFRYDLVWDKVFTSGFLDANRRPMRQHELILVFSPVGYPTYNPQMMPGEPYSVSSGANTEVYSGHHKVRTTNEGTRFPTSILTLSNGGSGKRLHRTQKPTALTDWVVTTYSNPGDTILDNTMGSATTGVSALKLGRHFIGIERDGVIFATAERRIGEALAGQEVGAGSGA